MEALLHSPLGLLLVGVGLLVLRRTLPSGRQMVMAAQQDGSLHLLVLFALASLLVTFLVDGGH